MLNVKNNKTISHGKGTVYLTSTTILFIIANYIMYVGIARILGPAKFGVYGVVIGLVTVVNGVLFTWAEITTSKAVSENQKQNEGIKTKLLTYGFVLFSLISLVYFLLAPYTALIFNDPSLTVYIRISAPIILFYSLYGIFQGYLNGMREFKKQAIIRVIYLILRSILILGFVVLGFSVGGAIFGFLAATFVGFIINLSLIRFKLKYKDIKIRKAIKFTFPVFGLSVIIYLLQNLGLFLIKALSPENISNLNAGYLTALSAIAQIPYLISAAFPLALFPFISKFMHKKEIKKAKIYIKNSLRYLILMLVPVTFLVSSNSKETIHLIYSTKYAQNETVLSILVFGFMFYSLIIFLCYVLSAKSPKSALNLGIITLMFNIALNLILIPKYGLNGTAIATTVSMFISFIIGLIFIFKTFKKDIINIRSLIKVIFSGLVIYPLSYFLKTNGLLLIIEYIFFAILFFIILILIKELNKKDLFTIKRIIFSK